MALLHDTNTLLFLLVKVKHCCWILTADTIKCMKSFYLSEIHVFSSAVDWSEEKVIITCDVTICFVA